MTKKIFSSIAIVAGAMCYQSCENSEHQKKENSVTISQVSEIKPDPKCANVPNSWFKDATTNAPDNYGPFVDTSTTSDCDFHLWSFQKFLSLTRSKGKKAPFEDLIQVSNDLEKLGKVIILTDVSQAGTKGTLYDKTNHPIYYSIFVNKEMYEYQINHLERFAKNIKQNKDTVITPGDTVNINTLHQKGLDTLNYPVGCFEVKVSWILATSLNESEKKEYYITQANIGAPNGQIALVDVALLGMHIVGRVANHPELIWATFEHNGLAPDYDWSKERDTTTKVLSDKNFLFYKEKTTVSGCPMNNSKGKPSTPQFSGVFNMFKYGMAESFIPMNGVPSHRDSANNANMIAINASVNSHLQKEDGPWKNYYYKGALWLDDPTPLNFAPGNFSLGVLTNPFLRGSRAISNITMETFAQLNFSNNYASGSMNCFGCHGTVDFKNDTTRGVNYNMALSHLFINALLHKFHKTAPKTE